MSHATAEIIREFEVPVICLIAGIFALRYREIGATMGKLFTKITGNAKIGAAVEDGFIMAGPIARDIAAALQSLPAGADVSMVKHVMIKLAATNLEPDAKAAIGAINPQLFNTIKNQLNNLPDAVKTPANVALIVPPLAPNPVLTGISTILTPTT